MSNESSSENRRHFSRFGFDAVCTLHQGENYWNSKLLDISLKGILTETPDNWDAKEGEPLEAVLKLADDDSVTILMSIELAHKEGGNLGFRCRHIDIDSITHLRRLVELNLGSAELLERELHSLIEEGASE